LNTLFFGWGSAAPPLSLPIRFFAWALSASFIQTGWEEPNIHVPGPGEGRLANAENPFWLHRILKICFHLPFESSGFFY
jgi:hypothetical protein